MKDLWKQRVIRKDQEKDGKKAVTLAGAARGNGWDGGLGRSSEEDRSRHKNGKTWFVRDLSKTFKITPNPDTSLPGRRVPGMPLAGVKACCFDTAETVKNKL